MNSARAGRHALCRLVGKRAGPLISLGETCPRVALQPRNALRRLVRGQPVLSGDERDQSSTVGFGKGAVGHQPVAEKRSNFRPDLLMGHCRRVAGPAERRLEVVDELLRIGLRAGPEYSGSWRVR